MVDVKRLLISIVIGLGFWALIVVGLYLIMLPTDDPASNRPDHRSRAGFPFG
jgi:hypothetical protein